MPANARASIRLSGWGYTPAYGKVYNTFMQQHPDIALNFDLYGNFVSPAGDRHLIQRLSPDGRLLDEWGEEGRGPGEFEDPSGIWEPL